MSAVLDTTKYRWFLTIPKKQRLPFHKKKGSRDLKRDIYRDLERDP
jgi:hypothetical protein